MDGQDLTGWWNSFPSDNAVLFFALAATVYASCRRAGVIAYVHAIITVAFAGAVSPAGGRGGTGR